MDNDSDRPARKFAERSLSKGGGVSSATGRKSLSQNGDDPLGAFLAREITPEMITAGVAFLRQALGDLYPPGGLPDERELVSEFWRAMRDAEDDSRISPCLRIRREWC